MATSHSVCLLLVLCIGSAISEECEIPGGAEGSCVEASLCAAYSKAMEVVPLRHVEYLRHVQCHEKDKVPYVCCPATEEYNFTEIPLPTQVRERAPALYNRFGDDDVNDDCGIQSGDRIFGGIVAGIDEFPWMALIEYGRKLPDGRPILACGGALISRRHVLTAAHCVCGPSYNLLGKIAKVRLGEYDIDSEQDCVVELGYKDCADPVVAVGAEGVLVHPDYRPESKDQKHDIAIIRLDSDVNFTDFVKPICLPDKVPSFSARCGELLLVAGWGKTARDTVNSPVKLKIGVPLVDQKDCQRAYSKYGIRLSQNQICAGGEGGKDSCKGDSGGPLMSRNEVTGVWVCSGVVSIGPNRCGQSGIPGVYTNVADYMPWIKSILKP